MDQPTTITTRTALVEALDVVDKDPAERFERIVRTAREVFGVPLSYINLVDETTMYSLTPSSPDEPRTLPYSASFCQFTIQNPEPLVIEDAATDARTASLSVVTDYGVRFYAGVPLTMPEGTRVGSLCLMDTKPRTLTDEEQATLVDLTRWAERVLAEGLQQDALRAVIAATTSPSIDVTGYDIGGFAIPLDGEVGGDVIDWTAVGDDVAITLADVMGKGRAAGILAAGLRGAIRARLDQQPDQAVAGLEAQLAPELSRAESFATLFHGRLTPRTGRLDFVDAGHGIVLHLRADGTADVVRSIDLPIGLHPSGFPRASGSLVLQQGDVLLVASDGVLDLGDGTLDALVVLGRKYRQAGGIEGFEQLVRARARARGEDDITVLVIERR
jgi:hypothetical protein